MPKQPSHQYKDSLAFTRLMLLIATLLKYPGVGNPDLIDCRENQNHNAIAAVKIHLHKLATELGIKLPENYPAIATLRKDLETLRRYGILERRMYRWGYYLGTGALSATELKVAFNALGSQAQYQGDAQVRRIYEILSKRLRGLDMELKGELFYPTRQYLNRAIIYTDPEEMAQKGQNRDTLFHQLPLLETAITQGQAIEIYRSKDLYGFNRVGWFQVFPLQLIYHDVAWYLLYELCLNGHLVIGRLNRFSNYCEPIKVPARGLEKQKVSLEKAYKLLENGWGLNLGELEPQIAELQGNLELIDIKVRFFPPVTAFIIEGELRHLKQKITPGLIDKTTGRYSYIEYAVELPPRSLNEFSFWVHRYLDKAELLSPPQLVAKHRESAQALFNRYFQPHE
ncbi:helix-turn-helix transcriptional regulator [Umezakia ovalisporum]|uniref:WYL domain-containing protein n=1 Tax=Umezakia ovalisporum FSS-62 TaxID=2971776 RepID=A0AA43GXB4_9CYAN|nr:WYL domain-containing protein [Umezakia ovalisporum]MDH6063113.1 WYL domain-containing protein [Umezakia ovalisporum FSS-62]MDH6101857.1 WYL domain-containing protein [Umezakia ovalisporum ANA283AFssAo]